MKTVLFISRILLGLIFVVFGINFWLKFIAVPPPAAPQAGAFLGILFTSGYLAVVKVVEVIGGLLTLAGRVPLGLLFLGPVIINILLFDVFLAHAFNPVSALAGVLSLVLLAGYRDRFAALAR